MRKRTCDLAGTLAAALEKREKRGGGREGGAHEHCQRTHCAATRSNCLLFFANSWEDSSGWTYVHEHAPQSVPGCACRYARWHRGQWCFECERLWPRRLKRWHERAPQHGHRTLQADVRSWNGGGRSSNGWFVSWHNRATPIGKVVGANCGNAAVYSGWASLSHWRVCRRTCRCCLWLLGTCRGRGRTWPRRRTRSRTGSRCSTRGRRRLAGPVVGAMSIAMASSALAATTCIMCGGVAATTCFAKVAAGKVVIGGAAVAGRTVWPALDAGLLGDRLDRAGLLLWTNGRRSRTWLGRRLLHAAAVELPAAGVQAEAEAGLAGCPPSPPVVALSAPAWDTWLVDELAVVVSRVSGSASSVGAPQAAEPCRCRTGRCHQGHRHRHRPPPHRTNLSWLPPELVPHARGRPWALVRTSLPARPNLRCTPCARTATSRARQPRRSTTWLQKGELAESFKHSCLEELQHRELNELVTNRGQALADLHCTNSTARLSLIAHVKYPTTLAIRWLGNSQ